MTDIEQKALALVNEVRAERRDPPMEGLSRDCFASQEALCRLIEQHETDIADLQAEYDEVCKLFEAFRQEVSDAVEALEGQVTVRVMQDLQRFIIAKPDPVRVLFERLEATENFYPPEFEGDIREMLERHGGRIVWGEG